MIKALIGLSLCSAASVCAETYSLGPDSLPDPKIPHGTVTHAVLAPGKFYPGTPHTYAVYLPAGVAPDRPLPFMIYLDGSGGLGGLHVPIVLDHLIAQHELPPMAAIFVDPGVLPTVSTDAQHRYERIFEYDSISARYSQFLLKELIPEVEKQHPLSHNPDDRGLAGVSTGAVGAFAAAWNRPDQFHRVLTLIGTFVDMKGSEELASLVRKTEPRPLRILLQDGRNDHLAPDQPWGTFYAGSWPINNQVMLEALQFAGYETKLEIGDGAHDTKQGAAMMPDALRWLWANYPAPITVHEPAAMSSPKYDPRGRVYSIVSADYPWELVSGQSIGVTTVTGDSTGNVYFGDNGTKSIYRINPNGELAVFRARTDVSVLQIGPENQLYAAEPNQRRIVYFDRGGQEKIVATGLAAHALAISRQGAVYFASNAEKGLGKFGQNESGVDRQRFEMGRAGDEQVRPSDEGRVGLDQRRLGRIGEERLGLIDPNGKVRFFANSDFPPDAGSLSLSPDQAMLAVSDTSSRYSWSFQLGADGAPINGEPYYRLYTPELSSSSGIHGVAFDSIGQVYFASEIGIQVTEQNGRVAAVLNGPNFQPVTQAIFTGPELKWLYAISGGRLYRRPTKVPGAGAWAVVTPPKPPL